MTPAFLDTNILLYAVSSAPLERDKRVRARALLESDDWLLSVQVLQEFYVNAVKKLFKPLTTEAAESFIRRLLLRDPLAITPDLLLAGIALSRRYCLSYWDGTILAAAAFLRCRTLYTEDLQHGQTCAGVRIVNPFL